MKKILFLTLILTCPALFASAFKTSELKVGHHYFVYFKRSVFYKAFIDKAELISKRRHVLLFKRRCYSGSYIYCSANLDDVKGEVND